MRIAWSPSALRDFARIYDYISAFNPMAACEMAERLRDAADSLRDFPERGRPIAQGRRELPVIWPYVIRYRIKEATVQILRVRHGRQHPLS
ncbi:addiction module toxin RelE [Paramagnetospirillum kuznetsovii]|uniref:Addiction module toxin RelE n=1 Tax=Paramagnetospirillum kuznetsovii TaxID=2053833 RepID=A0A364NYI7_9PROT|nr:type II toxin-antitoxin system RelE/ParE family toxin [Paramagnetospirillum kuznetsovii]RAU22139.1 addiction module toxin RelE [Paramagnetospirillum kuznetsovii]